MESGKLNFDVILVDNIFKSCQAASESLVAFAALRGNAHAGCSLTI